MHLSDDPLGEDPSADPDDFRKRLKLQKEVESLLEPVYQFYLCRPTEGLLELYFSRTIPDKLRDRVRTELKRRVEAGETAPGDIPLL